MERQVYPSPSSASLFRPSGHVVLDQMARSNPKASAPTVLEIGDVQGRTEWDVKKGWKLAKAWLARRLTERCA